MKMNKKGFTLIEMLVVIAIIAILVAIIIPTVSSATEKARQAADVANIRSYVAEYEIATLGSDEDKEAALAKLDDFEPTAKADGVSYDCDTDDMVVTYTATELHDGNGEDTETYTWSIGDIFSES